MIRDIKIQAVLHQSRGCNVRTVIVRAAPFVMFLLAGCGIFDSVEPGHLAYSATNELVSVSPTKIRVAGMVTNTDSKAVTVNYGPCVVGIRVTSKNAGSQSTTVIVDPAKTECESVGYSRTINPGESIVLGEAVAVLSGNVAPGAYEVTAFFFRPGSPEASAGTVEVR